MFKCLVPRCQNSLGRIRRCGLIRRGVVLIDEVCQQSFNHSSWLSLYIVVVVSTCKFSATAPMSCFSPAAMLHTIMVMDPSPYNCELQINYFLNISCLDHCFLSQQQESNQDGRKIPLPFFRVKKNTKWKRGTFQYSFQIPHSSARLIESREANLILPFLHIFLFFSFLL